MLHILHYITFFNVK